MLQQQDDHRGGEEFGGGELDTSQWGRIDIKRIDQNRSSQGAKGGELLVNSRKILLEIVNLGCSTCITQWDRLFQGLGLGNCTFQAGLCFTGICLSLDCRGFEQTAVDIIYINP